MSLRLIDSFDGYTTAEVGNYWTIDSIVFPPAMVSSPVHFGTQAINVTAFGIQRTMTEGGAQTFIMGFALFPQGFVNAVTLKSINDGTSTGTTTVASLAFAGDAVFSITRQIGGVAVVGKSDPKYAFAPNKSYHYIEWQTSITNAALNKIWIDGQLVLSTTISMVGTNTTISQINAYELSGGNYFDDFYFYADSGAGVQEYGDSGVACLFPTADGSFSEWTPNSGTVHFNRVNEIPADGDTTYNVTSSALLRDSYKVSTAIVKNTDIIRAAELRQLIRNDAGTGTPGINSFLVINGSTYTNGGNVFPPSGSYINGAISPMNSIFENNPLTTATWDGTTINQTEWGVVGT